MNQIMWESNALGLAMPTEMVPLIVIILVLIIAGIIYLTNQKRSNTGVTDSL